MDQLTNALSDKESESGLYVPSVTIIRSNGLTQLHKNNLLPEKLKQRQRQFPYMLHEPIQGPAVVVSAAYNVNNKKQFGKNLLWTPKGERSLINGATAELYDQYELLTKHKIRFQFRTALANKKTTLIDGAFGCGVFGNSPVVMAKLFDEVLGESEFAGAFEHVIFSVLVNSTKSHNFKAFESIFNKRAR